MKKNIPLVMGIVCIVLLLCVSGCGSPSSRSCNNKHSVVAHAPENSIKREVDEGLLEAVIDNDIANVKMLLMCEGADANAKTNCGNSALYIACMDGYSEIAELLLEHGADPNAKNDFGELALPMAVSQGHKDITTLLLRYGADVNCQVENGATALFFAHTQEMKELLLAHGADPKVEDDEGRWPTCMAVCWREGE